MNYYIIILKEEQIVILYNFR
ncbi:MAG: hypothetical protein H6P94_672, partial [Thermoplasmatales archaeon]|nr:hypothetical protein [Thermoplasmatales archaeon]